jgi:hypothetical protein
MNSSYLLFYLSILKNQSPKIGIFVVIYMGEIQGSSAIKGLMRQGFTSAMVLVNML